MEAARRRGAPVVEPPGGHPVVDVLNQRNAAHDDGEDAEHEPAEQGD